MNFEITKRHVGAAIVLGILFGVWQYQCNTWQRQRMEAGAEGVEEEVDEPVELSPAEKMAHLQVRGVVKKAHRSAVDRALRQVTREIDTMRRQREQQAPTADEVDVVTFLFSANVHGEREDCGCKTNPLGGLDRRQTLIELAQDPQGKEARKWWGTRLMDSDATFVADAGDLLFRSGSLDKRPRRFQEQAEEHARAVIAALNVNPPDVVNVGELDLSLGIDTLRELLEVADFEPISANLYERGGSRAFDGHRVVSRDGKKVAFVGLTKADARRPNYYEERGVEVKAPQRAYLDELGELPEDVDLVVLLSNLGVPDTSALVEDLVGQGARVDAAIVSNTNKLTRSPEWAAGVPIVEPLSRGKYFGRLDVMLGDQPGVSYANAIQDPRQVIQNYRRAWSSYMGAHAKRREVAQKKAELEQKLDEQLDKARQVDDQVADGGADASDRKAEKFVEATARRTRSRIEFFEKQLETLDRRILTTSKALAEQSGKLGTIEELVAPTEGDDWAAVRIVQLKLDMPQAPKVRRVLDRWKE
jgi:2',3'-cyclic-nucleotide 2'-phosphodiesterase (5'-nucleotidase family)